MQALLAFLRGEHMDDFTILPLFLVATFAGAFVAGLSGFAFGLVAASLWLYIHCAVTERNFDCRLRTHRAGLFSLAAAARPGLA
jgi:hypothetical protein